MKRALYVATRFPLPAIGGREQMILQSLRFLSTEYAIDFFYFDNKEPPKSLLMELNSIINGGSVSRLRLPTFLEAIISFLSRRNKSLQEHLFFSRGIIKSLDLTIANKNYDVVVFDMLRTAQYIEYLNVNAKKVVELDDLLSKRYRRLLQGSKGSSNILGTFQNKFNGVLEKVANLFLTSVLKYEISILNRRESTITECFDVVTLTSPLEAEFIRSIVKNQNVIGIPPAVDIYDKKLSGYEEKKEFDIIFTGNLKSPHNIATIEFIFNNVFTGDVHKRYSMIIVGDYFKPDIDSLIIPSFLDVTFTGIVDDVSFYMKKSRILLAPIPFGSGIKLKIIDAMMSGVPVITNLIGIEGIPAIDGVNVMIASDNSDYINLIDSLLDDEKMSSIISSNAAHLIEMNFDVNKIRKKYLDIIR